MKVKKAFYVLAIVTIFSLIAERLLFVLFPSYLIQKEFSATQIGIVFSLASFVLVISRFFIGEISDYIGRKDIMSLGLFLQSLSTLLFPLASRIYEYAFIKGLKDLAKTLESSVKGAIKADTFKKKRRARFLGKLESMVPLGRLIATPIGFFVVSFSIIYGFYTAAGALFLAFLVFTLFFESDKIKRREKIKINFKPSKYSKKFKALVMTGFFQSLVYGIAYLPAFFILAEKVLEIETSFLFALFFVSYSLSTLLVYPSGRWIDKIGRVNVTCFGVLLFSSGIFFYTLVGNWLEFLVVLCFISASFYLWRVAYKTSLYDSTIKKIRGEQIGFYKMSTGIGGIIAPLVGGFLIDAVSLNSAFLTSSFLGFFTFLFIFIRIKRNNLV